MIYAVTVCIVGALLRQEAAVLLGNAGMQEISRIDFLSHLDPCKRFLQGTMKTMESLFSKPVCLMRVSFTICRWGIRFVPQGFDGDQGGNALRFMRVTIDDGIICVRALPWLQIKSPARNRGSPRLEGHGVVSLRHRSSGVITHQPEIL